MDLLQTLPAILSVALIAGGVTMIVEAAGAQRKLLQARVSAVAGVRPPEAKPGRRPAEEPLVRFSVQGLEDADLVEVTRLCRRIGIGPRYAAVAFAGARLAFAGLFAAATLLALHRLSTTGPMGTVLLLAAAPLMAIVGWFSPFFVLRRIARHRADAVGNGLPEALELLVVCVEAGLSLEDSLDRVIADLGRSQPIVAEELALTSADLKILPDRDQAFNNLADRVGSQAIRSVVTTLSQTLRYGTPLAAALRTAASELRNESLLNLEERANRLPSLLTVPMMLFIMPTIFLVVGGPALLKLLDMFANMR